MGGLLHTLLPTVGISDVNHFNRATASRLRARTDGTTGTGLAWSGIKLASAPLPQSDAPTLLASASSTPACRMPLRAMSGSAVMGSTVISMVMPAQANMTIESADSSSVSIPTSTGAGPRG